MADETKDTHIAIWVLARELEVAAGELLETMGGWGLGWDVSNHMKRLSPAQADEARRRLGGTLEAPPKKLAVAKAEKKSKGKKKTRPKKASKAVKETVKKLKKKKSKDKKEKKSKKKKKKSKDKKEKKDKKNKNK